jgi:SAM-dependent methyltransferase
MEGSEMSASGQDSNEGVLVLGQYRDAAGTALGTEETGYRGLRVHAWPGLHEAVAAEAVRSLAPGASVLDLASGSGALALRLRDAGFAVSGCDLVAENFSLHGEVPFTTANLNQGFADAFAERFDAITAVEIIEHLENPRHFLRQCFALLRPGGRLILTTPNVDSPHARALWIRTGAFRWFTDHDYELHGHIMPIPLWLLRHALREAGFGVEVLTSVGTYPDRFLAWWKMHLFAWLLDRLGERETPRGEILLVSARKPD